MIQRVISTDEFDGLYNCTLWSSEAPLQLTAQEQQAHDEWATPYNGGVFHEFDNGFADNAFASFRYPGAVQANQYPLVYNKVVVGGHVPAEQVFGSIHYDIFLRWLAVQDPNQAQYGVHSWVPAAMCVGDFTEEDTVHVQIVPVAARLVPPSADHGEDVLFYIPLRIAGDAAKLAEAIKAVSFVRSGQYAALAYDISTVTDDLSDGGR